MSLPTYPEYKDSGVAWLGEIPFHWGADRIKASITSSKNGIWGDEPKGDETDILCVRVADFDRQKNLVNEEIPTVRSITEKERSGRLLNRGNLLLEKSGGGELQPVGQVVLFQHDIPAVCSNFVAKVVLANEMVPGFWNYVHSAAYAVRLNVSSINQTSGIQNLDQASYFNEIAPYPPIQEQTKIASFLDRETDKIDALIAEQEKLIELLSEKRRATISRVVTKGLNPDVPMKDSGVEWLGEVPEQWDVKKLSALSTKITNGYVGPTRDILAEEGVRYLQSLHVKSNKITFDSPYFVSEQWSLKHSKSILETGDVLIVQTGDIGQVAVVPQKYSGCNCHALIIVAPHKEFICGEWLSQLLNSDYGFHSLLSIQTGALHPHLNCGNVKELMIPVPPLKEQNDILGNLDNELQSFDLLSQAASQGIALLKERRSALISAAVTGKIDVRNLVEKEAA